jgi:endonuclease IV
MEEMEKEWGTRLAEEKAKAGDEDKKEDLIAKQLSAGAPYLTNLNEDPQLDRRVKYIITTDEVLTCGRRGKGATHKMKLGG